MAIRLLAPCYISPGGCIISQGGMDYICAIHTLGINIADRAVERRVQAQQYRNKAQLIAEEASAVVTAQSSSNRSGLSVEQRHHVREHMAVRERKMFKETRLKQKEKEDRRQALVLDQGLRKAAREKKDTKCRANCQSYFGGDGVVMDTSLSGAIL
jgi:hypothetical protein